MVLSFAFFCFLHYDNFENYTKKHLFFNQLIEVTPKIWVKYQLSP